jgi:hypothetical protein
MRDSRRNVERCGAGCRGRSTVQVELKCLESSLRISAKVVFAEALSHELSLHVGWEALEA